uniref:Uncharacterized protein n=1 Tax=Arundo donax TaxID=35708 RepID=A0A0A9CB03_ARUDO
MLLFFFFLFLFPLCTKVIGYWPAGFFLFCNIC